MNIFTWDGNIVKGIAIKRITANIADKKYLNKTFIDSLN